MANQRISALPINCKDLTGQVFTRLTALEPTDRKEHGKVVWKCQCVCGNICFPNSNNLQSGNTKSCGCLHKEQSAKNGKICKTHGMSKTSIYKIWNSMFYRCENSNAQNYEYYGGRGITVSKEFHDFQTWYEHIGPRPGIEYSQDRINNNGNYERGNIQWSKQYEQNSNRRPILHGPRKQQWFLAWHKDMMCQFMSNNQHEFARKHSLDNRNISACLCDKQKTHKNWIFKYFNRF